MWKEIAVNSEKYLVKHYRQNEKCTIHLTNLISIWIEEISTSSLIRRCIEQNPLIEADDESLLQEVWSLLDCSEESVTFKIDVGETCRKLEAKTKLAGIPFQLTFRLKLMSPDALCQEVTLPLLMLTQQLIDHQTSLCELLEAKDAEIEEYKIEGAQLKRRKLETTPFNRAEFLGNTVLNHSDVSRSLSVINHNTKCKENSCKTESESVIENGSSHFNDHVSEENGCTQSADTQEYHASSPSATIKVEPDTQHELKNIKKRKHTKPKLRL